MISDAEVPADPLIGELADKKRDALRALESLRRYRQEVDNASSRLESPQEIVRFIDYFFGVIGRAISECDRLGREAPRGIRRTHIEALGRLVASSKTEEARCRTFRDKIINKQLMDEKMRPLLNEIALTARDHLASIGELNSSIERLDLLYPPAPPPAPPPPKKVAFDRREFFTRWFRMPDE